MTISFPPPFADPYEYARENHVSLSEAESRLKEKNGGDPVPPSYFNCENDTFTKSVAEQADDEVVNLATNLNVSYETARLILQAQNGNPEGYEGADSNSSSSGSVAEQADNEVVNYANYFNVAYEIARAALKAIWGNPEGYEGADSNTVNPFASSDSDSDDTSYDSTSDSVDSYTKTEDDKYKEISDATGIDKEKVSAIGKALASQRYSGTKDEVISAIANDLGLSESIVETVASYLA